MLQGTLLLDKLDCLLERNHFLPDFGALANEAAEAAVRHAPEAEEAAKGILKLSSENFLLIGAILFFLSIIFSRTISRTGIPILALFLFVGFLAGEYGLDFSSITVARGLGDFALIFFIGEPAYYAGRIDAVFFYLFKQYTRHSPVYLFGKIIRRNILFNLREYFGIFCQIG